MQGLLLGLTLAPALEIQVGTMWAGLDHSLPARFQSFGQGSHGQLWASLNFPGHLGGVGPANGTRPVGLGGGGAAAHQTLLSPVPHPIRVCSAAWWERSPLNKPELLDNDKDEEGSPQAHPPPSPGSGLGCITFSHLSTHLVWNSWLQGRTRSSCRASKSLKQTTHLGGGHRSHFHTDG